MIDLDSRTVMLRELAFHCGTLDVVNEDTEAFEAVYEAIQAEAQKISTLPVPTPLRQRMPERVQAMELTQFDDADFIENAYLRILRRDADGTGACYYLLKLRNGEMSKDDIIFTLRMSQEGRRTGVIVEGARISRKKMILLTGYKGCQFVENAYNWLLGRKPTEAEVKQHLDMMEKGLSKRGLLEAFADSPERSDMRPEQTVELNPAVKYSDLVQYDDVEFVVNAYRRILGRQADVESAANYLVELRNGKLSKDEVLFKLRMSEEGRRKGVPIAEAHPVCVDVEQLLSLDGEAFLCAIYMWIFGREADESGLSHNQRLLSQGMRKEELLMAMLESPEAQGKPVARYIGAHLSGVTDAQDAETAITPEAYRQAESDIRQECLRRETMEMLESMRAQLAGEIDALQARDAIASIQACVAQQQTAIARHQAEMALAQLADARRQLAEQQAMLAKRMAEQDT